MSFIILYDYVHIQDLFFQQNFYKKISQNKIIELYIFIIKHKVYKSF